MTENMLFPQKRLTFPNGVVHMQHKCRTFLYISSDITILPKNSSNNDLNFVISSVVLQEMFTQMI
jgi:hypothetical protein